MTMANEVTLTSGEQHRPVMLLENGQAAALSANGAAIASVSNTVWQENNGTAGPGQDGAPAMIQCQP
jgi:hypothetical protein